MYILLILLSIIGALVFIGAVLVVVGNMAYPEIGGDHRVYLEEDEYMQALEDFKRKIEENMRKEADCRTSQKNGR